MPLLVHASELQPGMRLAESFLRCGITMFPSGKVLASADIDILHRRYPDVTLKIGDPVLDAFVEFEDDGRDREVARTAQAQIAKTLTDVQDRFTSRTSVSSINFQALRDAASAVVKYLEQNPVSTALLTPPGDSNNYLAEHSANVFYLCVVLGSALRGYVMRERLRQTRAANLSTDLAMDLVPLGLGAMFMDIGMYAIPQVFQPGYELTAEDRERIRNHPNAGADLLPDSLPPGVKMITRAHHENFDGTGYPAAIPGSKLHVFTRIARLCDAFDAATSSRVHAAAKSNARVLWEMRYGPTSHHYDPVLMKVFHTMIQPFPIGAKVQLSDGRFGVVVRHNHKDPFRPQVVVAFNPTGERLPQAQMSGPFFLGDESAGNLRISAFGGEDLSYLYDEYVPVAEPTPPAWDSITYAVDAYYP